MFQSLKKISKINNFLASKCMQESITTRKTCGNLRSVIFESISPMLAKEGIWFRWLADNPVVKSDLMQQKLGKNYFFCIQARTSLEMDGTLNLPVSSWGGGLKNQIQACQSRSLGCQ